MAKNPAELNHGSWLKRSRCERLSLPQGNTSLQGLGVTFVVFSWPEKLLIYLPWDRQVRCMLDAALVQGWYEQRGSPGTARAWCAEACQKPPGSPAPGLCAFCLSRALPRDRTSVPPCNSSACPHLSHPCRGLRCSERSPGAEKRGYG